MRKSPLREEAMRVGGDYIATTPRLARRLQLHGRSGTL
jgi:hypothetical protein